MLLFSELPICPYLKDRLSAADFVTPTAVQDAAIPKALEGKDILATAQTGTGKTLAFLVPIMEQLIQSKPDGVQALVLVPTRELALQVGAQYELLRGKKLPAPALVVGGMSEQTQVKAIRAGARLIVATPGRLEDFMDRRMVDLSKIKVLVLDEADRMLDMGFIQAIRRIVAPLPRKRQTLCFSATLEASVAHLVSDYTRNPIRLEFGSTLKPIDTIKLRAFEVATDQKLALLQKLLTEETGRTLVFARTKRGTERLAQRLSKDGFEATMIHGNRSQSQRNAALAAFQKGKSNLLIATDVASRGIHVDDITHVINYDLPELAEDFVHRVGRTGRAGASGIASTFITRQDRNDLVKLERTLNIKMERMSVEGELEREERAGPIDTSKMVATPVAPGSRMMRMPGEVLQRYS
jgi:ATP-dependent RNA helicase RhlE